MRTRWYCTNTVYKSVLIQTSGPHLPCCASAPMSNCPNWKSNSICIMHMYEHCCRASIVCAVEPYIAPHVARWKIDKYRKKTINVASRTHAPQPPFATAREQRSVWPVHQFKFELKCSIIKIVYITARLVCDRRIWRLLVPMRVVALQCSYAWLL